MKIYNKSLFAVGSIVAAKQVPALYEVGDFHKLAAPINALSSPSLAFFIVTGGSISKIVFVAGKNNSQLFARFPPITIVL